MKNADMKDYVQGVVPARSRLNLLAAAATMLLAVPSRRAVGVEQRLLDDVLEPLLPDFPFFFLAPVKEQHHIPMPATDDLRVRYHVLVVSITKCSLVIVSARAYLLRYCSVVTWVSNYSCLI